MLRISDRDEQVLSDLRRYNLRHPRVVSPAILKLLKLNQFSSEQMGKARTEWLKLGLGIPEKTP